MALTKRQTAILQGLITSNEPVTIEQLKQKYKKSERSIRYDIGQLKSELEDNGITLKVKNGTGYFLLPDQKPDVIRLFNDGVFEDEYLSNQDILDACFACLYLTGTAVSSEELAVEVGASKGTLNKAIKQFNQQHTDIRMGSSRKGIVLIGQEYAIRTYAIRIENVLLKKSDIVIPEREILRDAIYDVNQQFGAWPEKGAFETILDFCIVSSVRGKAEKFKYNAAYLQNGESEYAATLLQRIGLKTTTAEICVMAEMLMHCHMSFGFDSLKKTQLKNHVASLNETLISVARENGYILNKETLGKDLYAHLKQLAKCIQYGIELPENPMLQEIKYNYADMFSIAKQCTDGWVLTNGKTLSESEVSYIAIYLYKNIESVETKPKRVIIVCATGKGLSSLLATKIRDRFPQLNIVGLQSAYSISNITSEADFIISTIPITTKNNIPVIQVNATFMKEDENKIKAFLKGEKTQGKQHLSDAYAERMSVINKEAFTDFAEVQKQIVLGVTNLISSLPAQYHPSNESVLALLIHLNMAIPRWMNNMESSDKARNKEMLNHYQKNYPDLAEILNAYFKKVEALLGIQLDDSEKNAFYLYILA